MKKETKVINDTTYTVQQLDALSALKIQAKLIKILGPALGQLKGAEANKEALKEKILSALSSLAEKFDDDLVVSLVTSLFEKNVFYDHDGSQVKVSFEVHFTGKISEMWKVAFFVLEVNFGDLVGKFKSSSLIKEGLDQFDIKS